MPEGSLKVGFLGTPRSGNHHLLESVYTKKACPSASSHQVSAFQWIPQFEVDGVPTELYSISNEKKFSTAAEPYYRQGDVFYVCIPKSDLEINNLQHANSELGKIKAFAAPEKPITVSFVVTQANNQQCFTGITKHACKHLGQLRNDATSLFQGTQIQVADDTIITSAQYWEQTTMGAPILQSIAEHAQKKLSFESELKEQVPECNTSHAFSANMLPKKTLAASLFFGTTSTSLSAVVLAGIVPWLISAAVATGGLAVACLIVACVMWHQYQTYQPLASLPPAKMTC